MTPTLKARFPISHSPTQKTVVAASNDDTLARINETCLLMEEHVDIYDASDTENLVLRTGQHGGLGRVPADDYSLLCDVLVQLKRETRAL
jgi:hypothetical protein